MPHSVLPFSFVFLFVLLSSSPSQHIHPLPYWNTTCVSFIFKDYSYINCYCFYFIFFHIPYSEGHKSMLAHFLFLFPQFSFIEIEVLTCNSHYSLFYSLSFVPSLSC